MKKIEQLPPAGEGHEHKAPFCIPCKINQLVEAMNTLQEKVEPSNSHHFSIVGEGKGVTSDGAVTESPKKDMSTPTQETDWEKELIKNFSQKEGLQDMNSYVDLGIKLKYIATFIQSLLTQREEAAYKEGLEEGYKVAYSGGKATIDQLQGDGND